METIYTGDEGLQEAARDVREQRKDAIAEAVAEFTETSQPASEPEAKIEPPIIESEKEGTNARDAVDALQRAREARETQSDEIDRALGATPAAAPEEAKAPEKTPEQIKAEEEWERFQTANRIQEKSEIKTKIEAHRELALMQFRAEFPDITDPTSLYALAQIDPDRYARATAAINRCRAIEAEAITAHQEAKSEWQSGFNKWAEAQDKALFEKMPELQGEQGPRIADAAFKTLRGIGFTDKEIVGAWTGEGGLTLRDARMQELAIKAARYDMARANVQRPAPKEIPLVHRPGTSNKGSVSHSAMQDAMEAHKSKGTVKSALAALKAQRAARAR